MHEVTRYKPSKAMAIVAMVVGAGMLAVGITLFTGTSDVLGRIFIAVWCIAVASMVSYSTWAAFSRNGSVPILSPIRLNTRKTKPEA